MFLLILEYWPKLITALWFSVLNLIMCSRTGKQRKSILLDFVVGFFVSPSFVSIIGEQTIYHTYVHTIFNYGISDNGNFIFIGMNILGDVMFTITGGILFSRYFNFKKYLGATLYMEYICIERFALVIAVTYPGYIVIFFVVQCIIYIILRNDEEYLFNTTNSVDWRKIFIYLIGLFYILDLLYAGYFIFPELGTDIVNLQNVLWLDIVAIIASSFVTGYLSMCISEAKEHDSKLNYFMKLQQSQENIIITLTEISEAKSGETGQHVRRVSEYSKLLASTLKMTMADCETLKIASMMHDLGKLLISSDIIEKPGQLTNEEYEIMKQHTIYGYEILSKSDGEIIDMARTIALQHHEHWDGRGYPHHLSENQISIYAQIVAVADVFDALTSNRSYKNAWSLDDAKAEIINQRGKHFSPKVVDAFIVSFDAIRVIHDTYID